MIEVPSAFNQLKYPLFVTWLKNGNLRGCIGTFSDDQPFGTTLQKFGIISAVKDTRFPPISKSELPSLRVEISLLHSFEKIEDPLNWEVGTHGIEIEFKDPTDNSEVYRGTFLPNVASEQGWNQITTLEHLIQKAGYYGSLQSVNAHFVLIRRY